MMGKPLPSAARSRRMTGCWLRTGAADRPPVFGVGQALHGARPMVVLVAPRRPCRGASGWRRSRRPGLHPGRGAISRKGMALRAVGAGVLLRQLLGGAARQWRFQQAVERGVALQARRFLVLGLEMLTVT